MAEGPVVFLVDDDESALRAFSRILAAEDFSVRSWTSPAEFLDRHDPTIPGCLVTDLAMPGLSGLDLQQQVGHERFIIFVTGRGDIPTTVEAMKAGAVSFLPKPVRRQQLVAAVREAIAKDAAARVKRSRATELETRLGRLTPREREVLNLVAAGLRSKQIAARLGTAEKTVKVHRGRLFEKMEVRSATALVSLLARKAASAEGTVEDEA